MAKPVVAVVGRPNVGKSTLFNRLAGGRVAIVEDKPGVTRDRMYQDARWLEREFTLVDTGGIDYSEGADKITEQVRRQAELAIEEADAVIFLVDAREGLTPADEEIAQTVRKAKKPVLLVANKVEQYGDPSMWSEFYRLGLGEPIAISAAHGMNIGDLLDEVVARVPEVEEEEYPEEVTKIAVVGRPNVGKSSLVNSLLGEERVIVSDIPGTTRDAIDIALTRQDREYVLIDTAGMRRRGKIDDPTERYSVLRALRAIDRSDVVLMLVDAVEGVTEQDKKIAGYAFEAGKAMVLVVNKWDLVEKDDKTALRYTEEIRRELGFLQFVPIIFISALTRKRVGKVLDLVDYVAEQHAMRVSTANLNDLVRDAVQMTPPPADKGKRLKILYVTQASVKPPTFIFFVNEPELVHFSYRRFLENQLRSTFGMEGTPLKLIFRRRKEKE